MVVNAMQNNNSSHNNNNGLMEGIVLEHFPTDEHYLLWCKDLGRVSLDSQALSRSCIKKADELIGSWLSFEEYQRERESHSCKWGAKSAKLLAPKLTCDSDEGKLYLRKVSGVVTTVYEKMGFIWCEEIGKVRMFANTTTGWYSMTPNISMTFVQFEATPAQSSNLRDCGWDCVKINCQLENKPASLERSVKFTSKAKLNHTRQDGCAIFSVAGVAEDIFLSFNDYYERAVDKNLEGLIDPYKKHNFKMLYVPAPPGHRSKYRAIYAKPVKDTSNQRNALLTGKPLVSCSVRSRPLPAVSPVSESNKSSRSSSYSHALQQPTELSPKTTHDHVLDQLQTVLSDHSNDLVVTNTCDNSWGFNPLLDSTVDTGLLDSVNSKASLLNLWRGENNTVPANHTRITPEQLFGGSRNLSPFGNPFGEPNVINNGTATQINGTNNCSHHKLKVETSDASSMTDEMLEMKFLRQVLADKDLFQQVVVKNPSLAFELIEGRICKK